MKPLTNMHVSVCFYIIAAILLSLPAISYSQPKLVIPTGHASGINTTEFSSNGKWFVTASNDQTAKIWETATCRLLISLEGHTSCVLCAKFSPDNKMVVTGSLDNTAKIWETTSGRMLHSLEGHTGQIYSAQFSHDGQFVVTASGDNTARIWETASGKLVYSLQSISNGVLSLNGKLVATASKDGTIKIWDLISGRLIHTLIGDAYMENVVFSSDGRYIVATGWLNLDSPDNRTVKIWDTSTGKIVKSLVGHTRSVWSAHFSPDSKKIVTGSADGTIKIWDVETGTMILSLPVSPHWSRKYYDLGATQSYEITSTQFSPDGKLIATVTNEDNNRVKIWDASSGKMIQSFKSYSENMSFSPDGKLLLTTTEIWEVASGRMIHSLKGHSKSVSVQLSPDGKLFTTISGEYPNSEQRIKLWSIERGNLVGQIEHSFPGRFNKDIESRDLRSQFSSDGKWILTYTFLSPSDLSFSPRYKLAKVWEAATGKLVFSIDGHSGNIIDANFSPNGKWIAISYVYGWVDIWEIAKRTIIKSIRMVGWTDLDFSPDSKWMVTYSNDTVKIWNTATYELSNEQDVGLIWPLSFSFSHDSKLIAVACKYNIIRIWETATGKLVNSLEGHNDIINSIEFSPDDKWIITSSEDRTAKIWDSGSGTLIRSLDGHKGGVLSAQFSPDCKCIVTSSSDKTIKIREASTGKNYRSITGIYLSSIDWSTSRILTYNDSEISVLNLNNDQASLSFVIIDSKDWVVTHPSGLFDASPGAMGKLYFVKDLEIIELDKLKDKYYEPGLWEKVISGKPIRTVEN